MTIGCVFNCRHPLWGGDGICITDDSDPTVDAACSCGAGFITRDGAGFPSCVPKVALVAGYAILGASGLLTTAFLLLHANQYRYLSHQFRSARRATIRIRALVSGSGCSFGMGLVGVFLAVRSGATALWDPGVVQATYVAFIPMILFACVMLAGFWVESLPSQLLPPNSVGSKLRGAAETHDLFFFLAWLSMGCSLAIGTMTLFFPPLWPARISDAFSVGGAALAVVFVNFVATQMTRFIETSSAKASAKSQEFYSRAKKSVRLQAAVLSWLGAIHSAAAGVRHLTAVGRGTPFLFNLVQFGTGFVALCVFAYFTTFIPPSKDTVNTTVRKPLQVLVRVSPMRSSIVPDTQRQGGITYSGVRDPDKFSSRRVESSYAPCLGGLRESRYAGYLES